MQFKKVNVPGRRSSRMGQLSVYTRLLPGCATAYKGENARRRNADEILLEIHLDLVLHHAVTILSTQA